VITRGFRYCEEEGNNSPPHAGSLYVGLFKCRENVVLDSQKLDLIFTAESPETELSRVLLSN
jgi:hypothetical protein